MKTKLLTTSAICACMALPASAATLIFDNGSGDGLFATASNWNPDTSFDKAALADDLIINFGFSVLSTGTTGGITWTDANVGSLTLGGSFNTQWISNTNNVFILSTGELTLRGGANPLPDSLIDMQAGGVINFVAETISAAESEHLSKITVNGQAAVIGTNVTLVSDGGSGSILTAVPEPSSTALIGLAGLGFILRRRR